MFARSVFAIIFTLTVAPSVTLGQAENVILITLDGLRTEEVFGGADERLMLPDLGVKDKDACIAEYGGETAEQRRRKLLPFIWNRVEKDKAWIAGDVQLDSECVVTNGKYFSYPGYSELLCGFADDRIDSNAKKNNENTTVLEFLNDQPELIGSVNAFCSWDVFPYIINEDRSGIVVNAGWMPLTVGDPSRLDVLNNAADNLFHEWAGVRYDVFTASGAMECMKADLPRVLYISLGETDDWAHAGRYDRYLLTARQNDNLIKQIWLQAQRLNQYRDKTAFVITTDHGRGDGREGWKNHGKHLPGSEHIWIAAFGAGVSKSGLDRGGEFTQSQIAATVAKLMGYNFAETNDKVAKPLPIYESN